MAREGRFQVLVQFVVALGLVTGLAVLVKDVAEPVDEAVHPAAAPPGSPQPPVESTVPVPSNETAQDEPRPRVLLSSCSPFEDAAPSCLLP